MHCSLICSRNVTLFLNCFNQHVRGIYALCCVFHETHNTAVRLLSVQY